jgi:PAS domain S-box-containing protein
MQMHTESHTAMNPTASGGSQERSLQPPMLVGYAVAAITVILATLLRLLFDSLLGNSAPFVTYFVAVVFAAWYGGFGPALMAMTLSSILADILFIPPRGGFSLAQPDNLLTWANFFLVAFTSGVLSERQRLAESRANASALEARQNLEELQAQTGARQRLEVAHREAEERLRIMIDSARDFAIFSLDGDGLITTWNTGAERIFGYQEAEILGRHADIVYTQEDREAREALNEMTRAARDGYAEDERWHLRKDGSRFFASGVMRPMRDPAGVVLIGFLKVARDMTERKVMDEERAELLRREQEARAAAEEANRLKVQFVAMISHELRTPLTSIKGFTSTLLAEDVTFDAESQRDFIQIMDDEADKLNELIEQLLDVSRMQAGTLRINKEPEFIPTIVNHAQAQLQAITREHELVLEIAPALPLVLADEQRMAQVLVNLVDNAAKYSPVGTRIEVSAKQVETDIQFCIADQGKGIAPEDRPYVFDAFRQFNGTERTRGVGLGLAICQGLVEAHGGRIWIEEKDPPGTNVCFTIPVVPATQKSGAEASSTEA